MGKELGSVFFFEVAVSEDVVKEFATGCVFEDDTDVFIGFYDVVEADDVGVFESLGRMLDSRKKWRIF